MNEKQEVRAKAFELALMYVGSKGPFTGTELLEIKDRIERELKPIVMAFESLITGEPTEWGVIR